MNQETILITGVSRRIGLHLAWSLHRQGYRVIGTYRRQSSAVYDMKQAGLDLRTCDFFNPDHISHLIESLKSDYSSLRAVVHNASSWVTDTDETHDTADIMHRMMQVHAYAPYRINRAMAPLLRNSEASYGDIIHVGDYVSSRGSRKHIAYAASKAAQDNLTYSFAASLAPSIKVNSIAPALILFREEDSEAYRSKTLAKSLLKREAGIDEFLKTVDYILASNYITGRVIALDGGRHLKTA